MGEWGQESEYCTVRILQLLFSQMGEEKITDNARKTKNEERAVCTHTLSVYVHQFYTSAKHHKKSIYWHKVDIRHAFYN